MKDKLKSLADTLFMIITLIASAFGLYFLMLLLSW
jgi:hypothetical protein